MIAIYPFNITYTSIRSVFYKTLNKHKMEKQFDSITELFPEADKLVWDKKKECFTATIIDAELDRIHCEFNNDNSVFLDTKNLTHVWLTRDNLNTLRNLIIEAEEKYNIMYKD